MAHGAVYKTISATAPSPFITIRQNFENEIHQLLTQLGAIGA